MKKRLFELAQRAKKCHSPYTDDFLEKFAELIVEECVDSVGNCLLKEDAKPMKSKYPERLWNQDRSRAFFDAWLAVQSIANQLGVKE